MAGQYGPDLIDLAALHGISPDRVVELHSAANYIVYFLGFVPGFAYLGGLPSEIAGTPRLAAPRTRVPAGSVAIGGDQTGIYPFETPGGWRLIGSTPMKIFDGEHSEMSRLRIGDVVRFKPVPPDQFLRLADSKPMIQVQSAGLFTTIQDLGRYGYGPLRCVSPSGAADPIALRLGNLLVGNLETAAALEMTLLGGTFVFSEEGVIAVTGSDFGPTLDGSSLPLWTACPVRAGQAVKIGPTQSGARCYLSVRGGIAVKSLLGSASTHILSRLGGIDGRQLRKGDVLNIHEMPAFTFDPPRSIAPEISKRLGRRTVIRATVAPQTGLFSPATIDAFYQGRYRVTEQSNRMGLRLEGQRLEAPRYSGQMITGRRVIRSHSSSGKRSTHRAVCGAPDNRGLSEDRKHNIGRPCQRWAAPPEG